MVPQSPRPSAALHGRTTLDQACESAWRQWQPGAIHQACEAAEPGARALLWRALAAFMEERADALALLESAWALASADAATAGALVQRALVIALLDAGAMQRVRDWLARWDGLAGSWPDDPPTTSAPWHDLAPLAAVALGGQGHGQDDAAAARLLAQLRQPAPPLSPDECLVVAQVLLEHQFAAQRFGGIDDLANAAEDPARFEAASPLMRARWLFTYGYAQHHTGRPEQADRAWQRALAIATAAGLQALALKTTLALARGHLQRADVDAAQALIDPVQPPWGAGRAAQLMELQQLRARVQLLRGNPASASQLLQDALHTAEAAGLPPSESAAVGSDLVQARLAQGQVDAAEALLQQQLQGQQGRDAEVSRCQLLLLRALRLAPTDAVASRQLLAEGLAVAEQARYRMFFRLLPATAAALAGLALRWQVAPAFVTELVRSRALPAPSDAGAEWPWPLWLQLLGRFEVRRDGVAWTPSGKLPQKPLELLRLLACQRGLALGQSAAADALWPEADAGAARKSFDTAVYRLRAWLGDASLLWVADGQVGLDATRVNADLRVRQGLIDRIEALAIGGRTAVDLAEAATTCLALVQQVMALTPGPLLPGMPQTPWLLAEQAGCSADTVRAALAAAVVLQRAAGTQADAECALLETALRIEPLAESLVARLMDAHTRAARHGDALRVYEAHRQRLRAHGALPPERLRTLAQALQGIAG